LLVPFSHNIIDMVYLIQHYVTIMQTAIQPIKQYGMYDKKQYQCDIL